MYKANDNRYADMAYRRCGRSGLLLPVISLGLWHNSVSYTHLMQMQGAMTIFAANIKRILKLS